jgi:hypothetical protein
VTRAFHGFYYTIDKFNFYDIIVFALTESLMFELGVMMERLVALLALATVIAFVVTCISLAWGLLAQDDKRGLRLLRVATIFAILTLAGVIVAAILQRQIN